MVDEPFIEVIGETVAVLERIGIPYAITGSIASGIHGEPIQSQDVDIAIRMTPQQAKELSSQLPLRFYRSADRLEEVARAGGLANLIDMETTLKIDLSVLASTPFYDAVMRRRSLMEFIPDGPSFYTVTPEDVILMKLLWRKDTQSVKQWENALSVARRQGVSMDWKYLFDQARSLGIEKDLVRLRDEAGI
ncbi:MAG: hypothetical protein Q7R41_15585 [Phycisphaerales bacterium]|nr:hypothetical protein [Phycisphaerales bacterium]